MFRKFLPCLALVLAASAFADEIENPAYENWAQFKVGAMVEYKTVSDVAGNKTESVITYTLLEVTDEKAVIEMKTSTIMAGQKYDTPAVKMEHPAVLEATPEGTTEQPEVEQTKGEESIDAAGQTWATTWYESATDQNGMKTTSRTWTSDDVPGTLVKSVTNIDGAMKMTTEMILVTIKAEKN